MAGKIPVLVGEKEELVNITVSDEDYLQIMSGDQKLLEKLILEERERRSINTIQQFINNNEDASSQNVSKQDLDNFDSTSQINNNEESKKSDEKETFNWPEKAVLYFLELYREKENEFNAGLKRHNKLWSEIASEMQNLNYNVCGVQVQNKMSSLKRTYKRIKDSNGKSGNHNSTWVYYSVMDSLFGEKSWVSPSAIASSDGPNAPSVPSELASSSSSTCDNSMDFAFKDEDISSKPKKRKVEAILDSFISELKNDKDKNKEERRLERKEKEEKKQQKWEAYTTEKREMHKETSEIQRSLVNLLGKFLEKNNK